MFYEVPREEIACMDLGPVLAGCHWKELERFDR
jgi:hypothetical protein